MKLLLVCNILSGALSLLTTQQIYKYVQDKRISASGVLQIAAARSGIDCAAECSADEACTAVDMPVDDADQHHCILVNTTDIGVQVIPSPPWGFMSEYLDFSVGQMTTIQFSQV